jgi:flagellar basal body-associated protein FliL
MVTLEPFVVNLSDVTEIHYLRVQLSIELRDEAAGKEFETKKIPVRDRVIFYLSGLTMDELRTPSDKDVVRQRLLEIIRDASGNRGVRHIYFNEFMVQ